MLSPLTISTKFCRIQNLHISQTVVVVDLKSIAFCRIQNLHISQTSSGCYCRNKRFCRIQNLHISQTFNMNTGGIYLFCRIQNLHISQTAVLVSPFYRSFVEFEIYISLKPYVNRLSLVAVL